MISVYFINSLSSMTCGLNFGLYAFKKCLKGHWQGNIELEIMMGNGQPDPCASVFSSASGLYLISLTDSAVPSPSQDKLS